MLNLTSPAVCVKMIEAVYAHVVHEVRDRCADLFSIPAVFISMGLANTLCRVKMFVVFDTENIWHVYDGVGEDSGV